MPRGGKREGAGRKRGSATRRTREIANKAFEVAGGTPLEVMLTAMQKQIANDEWDKAAAIAKDAAPYVHPRLSSVEANVSLNVSLAAALDGLKPRKNA